jgi:predicted RNase H-like nuclease (RuvC/YqgF family)
LELLERNISELRTQNQELLAEITELRQSMSSLEESVERLRVELGG